MVFGVAVYVLIVIHLALKAFLFKSTFGVLQCVFWEVHIFPELMDDTLRKPGQNFPLFQQQLIQ